MNDKKKCDNIQQIKNINRGLIDNKNSNEVSDKKINENSYNFTTNRLKSKFNVNEGVDNIVKRIKNEDKKIFDNEQKMN